MKQQRRFWEEALPHFMNLLAVLRKLFDEHSVCKSLTGVKQFIFPEFSWLLDMRN